MMIGGGVGVDVGGCAHVIHVAERAALPEPSAAAAERRRYRASEPAGVSRFVGRRSGRSPGSS